MHPRQLRSVANWHERVKMESYRRTTIGAIICKNNETSNNDNIQYNINIRTVLVMYAKLCVRVSIGYGKSQYVSKFTTILLYSK